MKIILWINIGFPGFNQFAILENSHTDLANRRLIRIGGLNVQGIESHMTKLVDS